MRQPNLCELPGLSTVQLKRIGKGIVGDVCDVWVVVHSVVDSAVMVVVSDDAVDDINVDVVSV